MEKDIVQIRYLSDNERCADLINGVVFRGRQVVRGDDFQEMDSQTGLWKVLPARRIRKAGKKYRDLVRKVAMGVNFTVIGVENQDKVHYLMPLRTMGYDAAEYERQAAYIRKKVRRDSSSSDAEFLSGFKKTSRLYPCVTLVMFYGKDWDGSRDLHGLLDFTDIPEELRGFVGNYQMHLIEVRKFQDTGVFCTDLKQVFDFIRCSEDRRSLRELVHGDAAYQGMDEDAYDMAVAYADASELVAVKEFHRKDGKIDMCKALTELIEEGREEGRKEGRKEGREEGREEGRKEGREEGRKEGKEEGRKEGWEYGIRGMIMDNLEQGMPQEQIAEKLCRYFGVSSDKAQEYLEKVMK